MFANTYQSGFLSILYGGGAKPLSIWCQKVKNGHIRRVTDEDVQTLAVELMGSNVATTYIVCPDNPKQTLGIRLPFFVMIVKNMKKYFTFEITILDDKNMSRRFRVSNYQSTTRVRPFSTTLPIGLTGGWNQIQFNLADFTRRAYGSSYTETLRVQIHANVRIRRIYFSDRLYAEDEMPAEFKLYVPIATTRKKPMVPPKQVEDKSTGRDVLPQPPPQEGEDTAVEGDIIPSGAPPSPMESPRAEDGAVAGSQMVVAGEQGETSADATADGEDAPTGEIGDTPAEGEDQSEAPSEAPTTTEEAEAPAEGAEPVADAPPEEAPSEVVEASEAPSEAQSEAPAAPPAEEAEPEAAPTE